MSQEDNELISHSHLSKIETIDDIKIIEGSEKLELAKIGVYNVAVYKNKHRVGEEVVFIRIDTLVDKTKPYFNFMKDNRVKTMKIAGIFSQGIILSLNEVMSNENMTQEELIELSNNDKLSELLGVTKYHKINEFKQTNVNETVGFPVHIAKKTDEVEKDLTSFMMGMQFYYSLKMDGSSMTLIWKDRCFYACSRNLCFYKKYLDCELPEVESDCTMLQYIKRNGIHLKELYNHYIQGEFCGPKIGGNRIGLPDYRFYVFNSRDLDNNKYHSLEEMTDFCQRNGFETVPILHIDMMTEDWTFDRLREIANNVKYGERHGEGIVIRTCNPVFHPRLKKPASFKIINQRYKD